MRNSTIAMLLLTSLSTPVVAQDAANDAALTALKQAETARQKALASLAKADDALREARQLVASKTGGVAITPLAMDEVVEQALCLGDSCPSKHGLSDLAQGQLGISRLADHRNTSELAFHLQGGKEGNYASVGPVFVRRAIRSAGTGEYRARIDRIGIKGFASFADDDSITLGSWSASDGVSGNSDMAIGFDWRRSWTAERPFEAAKKRLVDMLTKIGQDCAKELNRPYADTLFADAKCREWVAADADRQSKYYSDYVLPLWGFDKDGTALSPEFYVGAKGKFGFLRETFFALEDPANTGVRLLSDLPVDLSKDAKTTRNFNPIEVTLYGGHALAMADYGKDANKVWEVGIAASIGWQRAVRYPDGKEDVSICYEDVAAGSPTLGFSKCDEINIAAPYQTDGLVFGTGFNFRPPRTWIGRPYVGTFVSYDTAVDQWTASVPVAFAVDKEGKLKAGLKFSYSSSGETYFGEKIPAKGNIGVFLEHDLTFPFVP